MSDQAAALRLVPAPADREGRAEAAGEKRPERILAVASGKGGVGKSSIALNLALDLARRGRLTYLLDADFGMANAGILAGIQPRWHMGHLLSGERTIEEIVARGPWDLGILSGASGLEELANLSADQRRLLGRQMSGFQARLDYLVVDTGAGISSNVISFVLRADQALVVATPEPTSLADAYGLIKTLHERRFPGRISVVVNRAQSIREARATGERLVELSRRYLDRAVDWAGFVLEDPAVGRAVRKRAPFVVYDPSSTASRSVALLADRIESGSAAPPLATDGPVQRITRWFERLFG